MNNLNDVDKRAHLCRAVNRLYGSTAPAAALRTVGKPSELAATTKEVKHVDNGLDVREYVEWVVNISVQVQRMHCIVHAIYRTAQKHAVNTSFYVNVFLGSFVEDPEKWPTEENLVGSHLIFTTTPGAKCAKCEVDREKSDSPTML